MSLTRTRKFHLTKPPTPTATSSREPSPNMPRKDQPHGPTTWVYAKEFGNRNPGQLKRGTNITISPNGNILVADQLLELVNIYNVKGRYVGCLDMRQQQHHNLAVSLPWDIAVGCDGTYYVTDLTEHVKVFDAKGKFSFQFGTISPDNKTCDNREATACLVGMIFDNNGTLLIGETERKYISRHAPDGRHLKSIRVNIPPRFLSVTPDNNIIVSAWESNTDVQILNSNGHLLHTLGRPLGVSLWETTGVCYRNGFIYVSNSCSSVGKRDSHSGGVYCFSTASHSGGVYCFSLLGEYVSCATKEVNEPCGLIVTDDGDKMFVINHVKIDGRSVMCAVKEFTMKSG